MCKWPAEETSKARRVVWNMQASLRSLRMTQAGHYKNLRSKGSSEMKASISVNWAMSPNFVVT